MSARVVSSLIAVALVAACAEGAPAASDVELAGEASPAEPSSPLPLPVAADAGSSPPPPLVCAAGTADCNGNRVDACETNLTNDVSSCGTCGNICPIPVNAAARCEAGACRFACWPGFVDVAGSCSTFGGSFAVNDPGACNACDEPNPMGGTCGCPAGFPVVSTARILDDCSDIRGARLTFCGSSTTAGYDWNGVYEIDDAVGCSAGCRLPNALTGACSCPAGATPIKLRTLVDTTCGTRIGSQLVLCLGSSAKTATFGGAFQVDDPVPGGYGCRVANPKTGACSCPPGVRARTHRVIADTDAGPIGSRITVCGP